LLLLVKSGGGVLCGGGRGSRSRGSGFGGREALFVPRCLWWRGCCGLFFLDAAGEAWWFGVLGERRLEGEGSTTVAVEEERASFSTTRKNWRDKIRKNKKLPPSRSINPRASASLDAHRASKSAVTAAAAASLAASSADAN